MLKCPKCQATHSLRRNGATCACTYQFVFDKADPISDPGFLALIKRASRGETYFFTETRLFGEYCAMKKRKIPGEIERRWTSTSVVAMVAALGSFALSFISSGFFVVLAVISLWLAFSYREKIRLSEDSWSAPSRESFDRALQKWLAAGRTPEKLLRKPMLGSAPVYRTIEDDVFKYGVEKIIITDADLLVDLLVKNHAHAEQKALIVAESGYPAYLQDKVKQVLQMRPDLPVILLHSANPRGAAMAERLRASNIYPLAKANIVDAGLYPAQVRASPAAQALGLDQDARFSVELLPYPALLAGLSSALVGGFAAHGALLPAHVDAAANKHKHDAHSGGDSGGDSSVVSWLDGGNHDDTNDDSDSSDDGAGDFSGGDDGGGDGDFG